MQLVVFENEVIDDPSFEQLSSAIDSLAEEEFLVLAQEDQFYMQVFRLDEDHYQFEYRDGSEERHFEVDPDVVNLEQIKAAFQKYLDGDTGYQQDLDWTTIDLSDADFVDEEE